MDVYIPSNTTIPCKEFKIRAARENQTRVRFKVFEGDDNFTKNKRSLGEFEFGVHPEQTGTSKFKVGLGVDVNGVLSVAASIDQRGSGIRQQETEETTFLNHIRSGIQIHFAVAIDFSYSNGVYTHPNSLHFLNGRRLNHYQIALRSIGELVRHYDRDLLFPSFGFGAAVFGGHTSHQFPLNMAANFPSNSNKRDPRCRNIGEILLRYGECLRSFDASGPTKLSCIIKKTISIAKKSKDQKHYFVLLAITDGEIHDMKETKRAIAEASTLPISVIIIGVGDSKFEGMKDLASGSYNDRDIVQFVQLNKFIEDSEQPYEQIQVALAKEVIANIPRQLTKFVDLFGEKPESVAPDILSDNGMIPTAPNY